MTTHADWQRAATSWVDEFLDFSSAKLNVHWKEKIGDEEVEECEGRGRSGSNKRETPKNCDDGNDDNRYQHRHRRRRKGRHGDDDDEQVMSMLPESAPTSEDNNSDGANGNEKGEKDFFKMTPAIAKNSQEKVVKNESEVPENNQIMDPKRIKRILANRQSAQRSRIRKVQYISELERSVSSLQTQVSVLSPRVAYLDHQRSALTIGNSALRQRIVALAHDKIFKDAHQEALKKEIDRLQQLYEQQNHHKTSASSTVESVTLDS